MRITKTKLNSIIIFLLFFGGYYKVCFYQVNFKFVQIGILLLAIFLCLYVPFHYKPGIIKTYLPLVIFSLLYIVTAVISPTSVSKYTSINGAITSVIYFTIIFILSSNYDTSFFLLTIRRVNFMIIIIYFLMNFNNYLGALGTLQRVGSALNDNPIWVGRLCAYTFLAMILTDIQRKIKINWIISLQYIFVIFVLVCTGSKGAWLAVIIPLALYYFVIFSNKNKENEYIKKRIKHLMLRGFIACIGILTLYGSTIISFILYRFNSAKSIGRGSRIDMYTFTINMIKKNPIVGYGLGSWAQKYWMVDQYAYPHNIILEVWFECGLFCMLFLLLFFLMVIISEKRSRNPVSFILINLFVSGLVGAMFSGSIFVGNREIYLIPILVTQSISIRDNCRSVKKRCFDVKRKI